MSHLRLLPSPADLSLLRATLVAVVSLSVASLAAAADISGTYSDKGILATPAEGSIQGEPSLNAILNLDFTGSNETHAKAAELKFEEAGKALRVEVFDNDSQSISRTTWQPEDGYTKEENRSVLILRAADSGTTRYLLQFVPVSDGKLLEVTVVKLTASAFGPIRNTTGVYVFPRL